MLFDAAFRPMDPELAHKLVFDALAVAGQTPVIAGVIQGALAPYLGQGASGPGSVEILGQRFPAPFGLAAGFDKDARAVRGLSMLGFAFVEVGTITPRAQPGNPQPRLWRETSIDALRNQMGFNNAGAHQAAANLRRVRSTATGRAIKIGVNIGKNKTTAPEDAATDYAQCAMLLAPYADYLVVNVSSPNTPGLRDLQQVESLRPILQATLDHAGDTPVLVKVAPDLADEEIDEIADLGLELGLGGFVAVNTTINHDLGPGGLSGPPEKARGLEVVARLRNRIGNQAAIIGCGGISTAADAKEYLVAGADLVQGYTGFIYHGPLWPSQINRALENR